MVDARKTHISTSGTAQTAGLSTVSVEPSWGRRKLYSHVDEDHRHNVWAVHTEEGSLIETLNLDAFRTATEIEQLLEEIVLYDPRDRTEWVNSR